MQDDERRELENQLVVMGMDVDGLTDPALLPMMAQLIESHDVFLGMIGECEADKRTEMYEALRPHMKFKPWPLEKYMNLLKMRAENVASRHDPIEVGERRFREVERQDATGCLIEFTCSKCTKMEKFIGVTPVETAMQAREAGWVRDLVKQKEICPTCPKVMPHTRIHHA